MIAFALSLALSLPTYRECVPSQSGRGYLPTPCPCVVTIKDPRTGKPEVMLVRLMVRQPKPMRPGVWPLEAFYK